MRYLIPALLCLACSPDEGATDVDTGTETETETETETQTETETETETGPKEARDDVHDAPWGTVRETWARQIGGASIDRATAIAVHDDGVVWVGGEVRGEVDRGDGVTVSTPGHICSWIGRFDQNGDVLSAWPVASAADDASSSVITDLAVDARGAVVVGHYKGSVWAHDEMLSAVGNNDSYVIALDHNGEAAWAKSFGTDSFDWGGAVALDAADGVFVGVNESYALHRMRLDRASGDVQWSDALGSLTFHQMRSAVYDGAVVDGTFWVGGGFGGSADLGGDAMVPRGGQDGFVVGYDALDGTWQQNERYGSARSVVAEADMVMAMLPVGDDVLLTGGLFRGDADFQDYIASDAHHSGFVMATTGGAVDWLSNVGSPVHSIVPWTPKTVLAVSSYDGHGTAVELSLDDGRALRRWDLPMGSFFAAYDGAVYGLQTVYDPEWSIAGVSMLSFGRTDLVLVRYDLD